MRTGKIVAAVAGLLAMSTPIAAQAVAAERTAAPVAGESDIGGERAIAPLFVLLALVVFLVVSASDDDDAVSA